MNLFKKIGVAVVGIAMAIGVSVAVGGNDRAVKADAAAGDVTITISYSDIPDGYGASGTSGNVKGTVSSANDLTIYYSGINTKSSAGAADHAYGYAMFLKNAGYVYSGVSPSGYYPSKVTVTFGSNTGTSGKAGIAFSTSSLSSRDSTVTGSVSKSGTCELTNSDKTKVYWNFSTTGANVQVDNIKIIYSIASANEPSISGVPSTLDLTAGGSSSTITATPSNIDNPSYSWSRTSGDDCITLTNDTSAAVTVAPKGSTFANCTLTLTVNGTNGGNPITPIVKNVAVSVNKVSTALNPFSVAEAKTAISKLASGTNSDTMWVHGIISQLDSYSSSKITYWISDDGTTTNQLKIYNGKGLNNTNFTALNNLVLGDEVTITGTLSQTYANVNANNYITSLTRIEISSIAVKTAPTKTAYISGESFAPAGLVITVTYSDDSTEDVAYSGNENKFSFTPATITAAGNVTISYGGETCTQAVTLLTVKSVTGIHSHPDFVYKDETIDGSDVELDVLYSDDVTTGVVNADHVDVDTSEVAASVEATAYYDAGETLSATFDIEVKKVPVYIQITDDIQSSDLTADGTSYSNFSNVTKTSDAVYKGNTSLPESGKIGFRSGTSNNSTQHSGIITTASGGLIYQVKIADHSYNGRTFTVYGKNTAYSDPNDLWDNDLKGDVLGTLSYSEKSLTVTGNYTYVAVRSTDGAINTSKISFVWKVEDAESPLEDNPVLSTGSTASVNVGKNISLSITTDPVDSDEKLVVTSSNENYVTVSGSGRNYIIHGVAVGSARVTVAGAKGSYSSYVDVTVNEAVKTYEDKYLTAVSLGITAYDTNVNNTYDNDGVSYTCYNVMKNSGMQFKSGSGYITNTESLYGDAAKIKSVTLFLHSGQDGTAGVYEGTSTNPSNSVSASVTTGNVVTYQFSENMTFFKVASDSGTLNIDEIIVELAGGTNSVLGEARNAATTILNSLKNTCGDGKSGIVTESQWNDLSTALTALNLSADAKLFLKDCRRIALDNLSQGGAEIENAMAHYDACVTKFGFTPDTSITSATPAGSRVIPITNAVELNNSTTIIVIISLLSVTALGGYFLLRRRKEN